MNRYVGRLAVGLAAGSMAATGIGVGAASASNAHRAVAHRTKSVTITFWDDNGGPRTPLYEHLIPIFERQNPGIKVKYVGIPDTSVLEKYDTAIQGGSPPDIAAIPGGDLSAIIAQNALISLNKYYQNSKIYGQILPTLLKPTQAISPNGKTLYALPFSGVPATLWCNLNILRPAGVTCPTTWNAFFTDAVKLTNANKNIYGFTMRGAAGATTQLIDEMISYAGLKRFFQPNGKTSLQSPRVLQFLQKFVGLYKKATPAADVDNSYLQMVAEFDSNKVGMMLHNLGSYASNVAAVGGKQNLVGEPDPAGPFNQGRVTMAAPGLDTYGIFKASKHQAQAWKFEQFLLGAEANGYWNKNVGQLPANKNVLKQAWVHQQQPVGSLLAALSSKHTYAVSLPNYLPQYGAIQNNSDPLWQEVMTGQITPAQWLDQLCSALDQAQSLWTHGHK